MEKLLAYCGFVCEECNDRKATLTNDGGPRSATAEKWAKEFNFPFTLEMISRTSYMKGVKITR